MDTTKASLLIRVKDLGNSQAWGEFVGLYRPMLIRFARARGLDPNEAENAAQDCLEAITRHIHSFEYDPEKGGFKKWLRTLVNNRVRSLLRKHREQQAESGELRQRVQEREPSPQQVWERIWLEEHVEYCLQKIRACVEPKTFLAFQHSWKDQWSVEKICQALGLSREQVYVAKSRVTRRLREMMTELLGESERWGVKK